MWNHILNVASAVVLALGIHELAHVTLLPVFGYKIYKIHVTIGKIGIETISAEKNPLKDAVIAFVGPLTNMLAVTYGVVKLQHYWQMKVIITQLFEETVGTHDGFLLMWCLFNLLVGVINLLPIFKGSDGETILKVFYNRRKS